MKHCVVIILITLHLVSSSLYATKTFLEKDYTHSHTNGCNIHQHHHFHNGFNHKHKHSHSQINIHFVDFFTDIQNTNFSNFSNSTQIYLETVVWIPNPTLDSLFRPPKV